MRFCPFCSAENADDMAVCQACGRRLPPLPPRRARNAPPTGVILPQRATPGAAPPPLPRRTGTTIPPPSPAQVPPGSQAGVRPLQPGVMVSPGATSAPPGSHAPIPAPAVSRESAPALPPPPAVDDPTTKRSILNAITPGPAAQRREAPPADPRDPADPAKTRRRNDQSGFVPSATPPPMRVKTSSVPPSIPPARPHPPTPAPPTLPTTYPVIPSNQFNDDFNTKPSASAMVEIEAERPRGAPSSGDPPPTRINRPEALTDRPFTPPKVSPIPEIPEQGLYHAARYAVRFGRARWQRRGAIKLLGAEIKQDTDALDQVLGALGRIARNARVDGRVFSAENAAITAAEERTAALGKAHLEVDARKVDENSKFVDVERERNAKLSEAERMLDEAQKELSHLEGQRRSLRDKRKELERRQKAYLKSAEDNDRQSGGAQMGDSRQELRRSAEQHRKEAAALEPDRQEVDRRLASLERPIGESTAKLDAAKAELDAAKRSLSDAREGHTHRLAELDAEQKRKSREIAQAESEISQRLVTLGTLVNLNRIDDPQFGELYQRIDRLRGAITSRTTEIEKLAAEREAFDRGSLVRGVAVIGGAIVALIALIVILRAIL
jgi:hypothetical protein